MLPPRNAKGQFMSAGGGSGGVGGVSASVTLDTSQVGPALQQLEQGTQRASVAMTSMGNAGGNASRGMTQFGSQMLIASAFIDDLQYGLRAVVNQIPLVVGAFGGSAGLAGAIGIVAVGLNVLVNHWDSLTRAFSSGASGAETASQEMKRLGDNTSRTADEQKRLNELKREEQQIETQRNRRPEAQERQQGVAGRAVQESPYDVLLRDVRGVMMRDAQGSIEPETMNRVRAEERRRANPLSMMHGIPVSTDKLNEIRETVTDELTQAIKAQAEELIRGAEFGSGRERRRLSEMARENPELRGLARFDEGINPPRQPATDHDAHVKAFREFEATGGTRPDLEKAFQEGLSAKAKEEADRAALGDKLKEDQAIDRVKAHADAIEEGRERKRERAAGLDEMADRKKQGREFDETESELLYRRYQVMNPTRQGQSMGLDQYEASIKSQSGETESSKRLKELVDIQKRMLEVQMKRRGLAVR